MVAHGGSASQKRSDRISLAVGGMVGTWWYPAGIRDESDCYLNSLKKDGPFHLNLNTPRKPIAKKYREGKMKEKADTSH